ncbi:hypothetical protein C8Q77DRAFT_855795 [Trametes polyzona]|nr:hypothetical protein C8Q77DRAFT_855795 [Trametes polyzona]
MIPPDSPVTIYIKYDTPQRPGVVLLPRDEDRMNSPVILRARYLRQQQAMRDGNRLGGLPAAERASARANNKGRALPPPPARPIGHKPRPSVEHTEQKPWRSWTGLVRYFQQWFLPSPGAVRGIASCDRNSIGESSTTSESPGDLGIPKINLANAVAVSHAVSNVVQNKDAPVRLVTPRRPPPQRSDQEPSGHPSATGSGGSSATVADLSTESATGAVSNPLANAFVQGAPAAHPAELATATSSSLSSHLVTNLRIVRQERPIRKRREKITWFSSSSASILPHPPMLHPHARAGDLYVHHIHGGALQAFILGPDQQWRVADRGHPHPYLKDYRLIFRANGQPSWVDKRTVTTYMSRRRGREIGLAAASLTGGAACCPSVSATLGVRSSLWLISRRPPIQLLEHGLLVPLIFCRYGVS